MKKYSLKFNSKNDESEEFTLTFQIMPSHHIHAITDVQVYQHRGDMFCRAAIHSNGHHHTVTAESLHNNMKFNIEIYVNNLGTCEVIVVEKVLTTVAHTLIAPTAPTAPTAPKS